ncbi:Kappa-type opioid receptor [Amphibalanus amphitrite]|uniref:Kappa-type opioid receptor n=1 Tax=Amphibalanus amphitrite TaxID=1232801 RepID=A0A6A4X3A1_AMPAM|nr:Kappa-type opioid receptor [Amphibalanus amphitrite]
MILHPHFLPKCFQLIAMDQYLTTTGLDDLATTWASTLGSSSLSTSSFTTSSLETSSLTTSTSTASPFANCTDLVDPPVCNITACNFGHGCIIDFSTMDMDPWRVMEPWRLALFGVGLALTTVPGVIGNVLVISIILSNNISVISVDRLWGLMRPFHRQIPPLAIKAIMLSTWVVAAAIAFYPAQFNKYSKRQYRDFLDIMCEQTNISRMRTYWWVVCVFLIWIPAIILFTCFVIIFIKMRRLKASNKKSGHHRFVSPATRARQRAVRLVFAMFVTFFICWTPFLVYVLQYQLATTTHDNGKPWEELYYASHFMMHLVPVINPVLYALLHENFRRAATVTCPWLPSKVRTLRI